MTDLMVQVMAELGVDREEDVLAALTRRFDALVNARRRSEEHRTRWLASEDRVRHLEAELAGTQQMLDVMTADPVEGDAVPADQRVHRATIELAVLRGLLNAPLWKFDGAAVEAALRRAQELLFAELRLPAGESEAGTR